MVTLAVWGDLGTGTEAAEGALASAPNDVTKVVLGSSFPEMLHSN
jgi:hypothetical protein